MLINYMDGVQFEQSSVLYELSTGNVHFCYKKTIHDTACFAL